MARASLVLEGPVSQEATDEASPLRLARIVEDQLDFAWRLMRRLGVPEPELDDACQQVFFVVSQRVQDIAEGSERTFVYGTCLRVASVAKRTLRRRREQCDDELDQLTGPAATPEDLADQNRARALLDSILSQLPEELRMVLVLSDIEGLTGAEIAELMGIPPGTAASRLRRAREDFRARLARWQAGSGRTGGTP